jgi:hypothetical protein
MIKHRKSTASRPKKEKHKPHQHPRQGPSQGAVLMATAILGVLYESGGTANINDVVDELLGPDRYEGDDARVFDEAFAYARHYGAIEIDTFCEHEKPAVIRMRAMLPLLPLLGPGRAVRRMICVHCGLANHKPIYDERLPDVIVAFETTE